MPKVSNQPIRTYLEGIKETIDKENSKSKEERKRDAAEVIVDKTGIEGPVTRTDQGPPGHGQLVDLVTATLEEMEARQKDVNPLYKMWLGLDSMLRSQSDAPVEKLFGKEVVDQLLGQQASGFLLSWEKSLHGEYEGLHEERGKLERMQDECSQAILKKADALREVAFNKTPPSEMVDSPVFKRSKKHAGMKLGGLLQKAAADLETKGKSTLVHLEDPVDNDYFLALLIEGLKEMAGQVEDGRDGALYISYGAGPLVDIVDAIHSVRHRARVIRDEV